jgi:hypothetical protein
MIPKEMQDKIKANAENYAGVMVWINKNPKGEEQLFYEYIAATSHHAGATEWAGRAQGLADAMKEAKRKLNILDNSDAIEIINAALAKYKEVTNE